MHPFTFFIAWSDFWALRNRNIKVCGSLGATERVLKVKNDHRSIFSNLSNRKEEA